MPLRSAHASAARRIQKAQAHTQAEEAAVKRRDDRVGALFIKHRKGVKAILRRLGVDGPEVDDLVQNVFLVAQRRIARLSKDADDADRWILDVARKQAANWRRLYRHHYEVLGGDELVAEAVAEPEDPEAQLALRDLVRRALGALDESERQILLRHHVNGESLAELGERLGLTKAGAHVRVQQAEERFVRRYQANR
jgi:RNA polymerase sigma-70 factor (ECF subfamily)